MNEVGKIRQLTFYHAPGNTWCYSHESYKEKIQQLCIEAFFLSSLYSLYPQLYVCQLKAGQQGDTRDRIYRSHAIRKTVMKITCVVNRRREGNRIQLASEEETRYSLKKTVSPVNDADMHMSVGISKGHRKPTNSHTPKEK
ncbi:hypothetical protein STEG23_022317 [Scotinomys teguina]